MKKILLIAAVLTLAAQIAPVTATAQTPPGATYHFSSLSGDDARSAADAQDPATPWRSLEKLNAIRTTLKPGDRVLFKRGETFAGAMSITASGTSANPITFGSYGSGANPVVSGFTTVGSWRAESTGIYSAPLTAANVNMVTVDGAARGMGRYPNSGLLNYEGANGNTSITDAELPASPSWVGAEIVVRKYRFILDRHVVTGHAGGTLSYSASTTAPTGNNAAFSPVSGNGYFIQNHLRTLDRYGEWYHDRSAGRLYVFFGGEVPANHVVRASTRDTNASVHGASHVRIENLDLEGANLRGLALSSVTDVVVQDVNFRNQGGSAVHGVQVHGATVRGGTIDTSFSNGINFEHEANGVTVDGVTVLNTNTVAGSGRSGSGVSIGITVNGDRSRITGNNVIGAGYSGIQFLGNDVLVERNYVDTTCTLKDDGGGIYTYEGAANTASSNRVVRNNIVVNQIGAYAGAEAYWYEAYGKCAGIYLDEHVNAVEVTGNTVANGDWAGIFLHNAHHNVFRGNTIYNNRYQVHVSQYTQATRSNTMTGNQYVAKHQGQRTWYYRTFVPDSPAAMGTFTDNVYARLVDDTTTIQVDDLSSGGAGTRYLSLSQWQSAYGLDAGSTRSPVTFPSNVEANVRFELNRTSAPRSVALDATYMDPRGVLYSGTITLQPYTSLVLLRSPVQQTTTTTTAAPTTTTTTVAPATTTTTTASQQASQTITFGTLGYKTWGSPPFPVAATASSGLPVSFRVVSGPATVSGNTVTITDVGTVTVEAYQNGDATYRAVTPVRRSFTVGKASQTITFPQPPNVTYPSEPIVLQATASSGLPITYVVVSGPATVSGSTVTITGRGTVSIKATQPGDSRVAAAWPPTRSFTVS